MECSDAFANHASKMVDARSMGKRRTLGSSLQNGAFSIELPCTCPALSSPYTRVAGHLEDQFPQGSGAMFVGGRVC